jgi:hypothetical protein
MVQTLGEIEGDFRVVVCRAGLVGAVTMGKEKKPIKCIH